MNEKDKESSPQRFHIPARAVAAGAALLAATGSIVVSSIEGGDSSQRVTAGAPTETTTQSTAPSEIDQDKQQALIAEAAREAQAAVPASMAPTTSIEAAPASTGSTAPKSGGEVMPVSTEYLSAENRLKNVSNDLEGAEKGTKPPVVCRSGEVYTLTPKKGGSSIEVSAPLLYDKRVPSEGQNPLDLTANELDLSQPFFIGGFEPQRDEAGNYVKDESGGHVEYTPGEFDPAEYDVTVARKSESQTPAYNGYLEVRGIAVVCVNSNANELAIDAGVITREGTPVPTEPAKPQGKQVIGPDLSTSIEN